MRTLHKMFAALLFTGAVFATVPAMSGCYATTTGGAYIVEDVPPPPRQEVAVYRPGYVWIHGRWTHPGRHWVWRGGYYERERPGHVYVEGRWERRGRSHVWVDGGWRARGTVVIR